MVHGACGFNVDKSYLFLCAGFGAGQRLKHEGRAGIQIEVIGKQRSRYWWGVEVLMRLFTAGRRASAFLHLVAISR